MTHNRSIIIVKYKHITLDLDLPLEITINELLIAFNNIFNLNINVKEITSYYLTSENPICLLKGNKTLADYNIRNSSIISIPNYATILPHNHERKL